MAKTGNWIETAKGVEIPAHIPRETWQAFVDMRAEKRAPLTPYACRLIFQKLAVYKAAGMDPKAVLDQSIERCWLTVYQLKNPSVAFDHEERPSLMDRSL